MELLFLTKSPVYTVGYYISLSLKGFVLRNLFWIIFKKKKSKAIFVHTWTGPGGSRRFRLPDFKTVGT